MIDAAAEEAIKENKTIDKIVLSDSEMKSLIAELNELSPYIVTPYDLDQLSIAGILITTLEEPVH
jgi:hypothetical protein